MSPSHDHKSYGASSIVDPPFSSTNLDPGDAHLHATLQRIDQIANEDVEMQGPPAEELTLLVLDTNILLHHFEVIQQFIADIEALSLPVMIIIPGVVIQELDGQKNREGLRWFARRASQFLLAKVKERRSVKGQSNEETCKRSGNWKTREPGEEYSSDRANDFLILDCCRYFQSVKGRHTLLCSADTNLCYESENAGVPTITPSQRSSSREVARAIYGNGVDLSRFDGYHASYKNFSYQEKTPPPRRVVEDDGMDVDDDDSAPGVLHPSHALDLLHVQVIDHFTRLLVELVYRVGGPDIHRKSQEGVTLSRYAPEWSQKDVLQWSATDCFEYLDTKKRLTPSSPRLEVFLGKPYACRGARRGQDWSRKDWDVAMRVLGEMGDVWQEHSIHESLVGLKPHLDLIFEQPMRPTGI